MPAKDKVHQPIRKAIEKDGWEITHDPYRIVLEGESIYADLCAEKLQGDNKLQVIVVEIKGFEVRSLIHALEEALGQYRIYRKILAVQQPSISVYLAVPKGAYDLLCQRPTFRFLMADKEFSLIIVDIDRQEIVEWIE